MKNECSSCGREFTLSCEINDKKCPRCGIIKDTKDKVHFLAIKIINLLARYVPKTFLSLIPLLYIVGCAPIIEWQRNYPDNAVEEMIEDDINNLIGIDVDLSPFTGKEYQK